MNRNYGYKYGFDDVGSSPDPCDETYKGAGPFSEKETQAVKNLVEKNQEISAAMNFHSWGNLWITPFCYYKGSDYEKLMDPLVYKFYREFEAEIKEKGYTKTGSAQETIQYLANGETSDWMLGEHRIIAMSPELGSDLPSTNTFLIPKDQILELVKYAYVPIKLFMEKTAIKFSEGRASWVQNSVSVNSRLSEGNLKALSIEIDNLSSLDLREIFIYIKYFNASLVQNLKKIELETPSFDNQNLEFDYDLLKNLIKINHSFKFEKLKPFKLVFYFSIKTIFNYELSFYKNEYLIGKVINYSENSFIDLLNNIKSIEIGYFLLILVVLFFFCIIIGIVIIALRYRKIRKNTAVMEMVNSIRKQQIRDESDEFSFK